MNMRKQADSKAVPRAQASNEPGLCTPECGKEVATIELKYDHDHPGEWGLESTPASEDAQTVALQAFEHYQFIRPEAISEILTDAFDNVANYGRASRYAEGTVRIIELQDEIIFRVENQSKMGLSLKLLEKPVTPADGIISLKKKERHPTESGGGNGLYHMTSWLPHVYRADVVETKRTGSLQWHQTQSKEKDHFLVTFELHIPIPAREEQTTLIAIHEYKQKAAQHWAAAEAVLDIWKSKNLQARHTQVLEAEIATCTRALESLVHTTAEREVLDFRHHTIVKALGKLGNRASSAAPSLRGCMLVDDATYVSRPVLLQVENDPEKSVQFFAEHLPALVKKITSTSKPDDHPIASIGIYAAETTAITADLQDGLMLAFEANLARPQVVSALATITLTEINRNRITKSLSSALLKKKTDEFHIKDLAKILAGQKELKDDQINLLITGLTSKASYYINQELNNLSLKQPQLEHARAVLSNILTSEANVELHSFFEAIKRCEGDKSVLFDVTRAILFDKRYEHYATELLEQMTLGEAQIAVLMKDTAKALQQCIAKKDNVSSDSNRLYHPLKFVKKHAAYALPIRDRLVEAFIAGVEEYDISEILASIGITSSQRNEIKAEVARRKGDDGNRAYYLEKVLKKP